VQKRKLGSKGPELSVIGLGTWSMGGPWRHGWGKVDDRECITAIRRALELGINWIDTAPAYGLGNAEMLIAAALEEHSAKPFLASKCGLVWNSKGRVRHDLNPGSIRQEIEASLKRLKVETIDLYQIHWPDPAVPIEKAWQELVRLRRQGKIRWLGTSNLNIEQLRICQAIAPIDSLQPPYNLFNRQIESEILPFCAEQGIGVVAYSPLASGLLSGNFDPERLAADDWRRTGAGFVEPALSLNLTRVEAWKKAAAAVGRPLTHLAIAWVLSRNAVTSAIVGARTVSQVETMVLAADPELLEWMRQSGAVWAGDAEQ
jgi:aryl-alcohol dehydrogenase-like predicted oxidoreductase